MISKIWKIFREYMLIKGFFLKNINYGNYIQNILTPHLNKKTYINLGAGIFHLKGWYMLDFDTPAYNYAKNKKFIQYDINSKTKLPFSNHSVDGIYCSHVIEHFKDDILAHLLAEFDRIVKKNCIVRIAVPDSSIAFRALKNNDHNFFIWDLWNSNQGRYKSFSKSIPKNWPIEYKWLHRFATERVPDDITPSKFKMNIDDLKSVIKKNGYIDLHNNISSDLKYRYEFSHNHINWYDYNKLEQIVSLNSNFKIQRSSYLQSIDSQMRVEGHFDTTWPQMTLYVDLIKK